MKNLTINNIISVCGGRWIGSEDDLAREISAVTTDSRTVTKDCLFAAIHGERVDGHAFAASALEQGALCALVQRIPEGVSGNFLLVPDTIAALQALAGFYRMQFDIPVIGITGSVGKTTAKEMVAAVLSQRYHVHKTAGNFNNDLGVPITLFGLDESHEAAVVEMGVSHPGDMTRLAEMVRPTMSLFTVIGHAHLEFLKSREGILKEKSVVNGYLPENGTVFCSGDDDLLSVMPCRPEKITFGMDEGCSLRARNVENLADGTMQCKISGMGRQFDVFIPAYGDHMVYAALEGAAVGIRFGLSDAEIAAGIAEYEAVGHRARRLTGEKLTVIDDCYNANPTSTASAIRSLSHEKGRKVCILGDMLELGEDSDSLHYEIGLLAKENGVDLVLAQGEAAAEIARGAEERGIYYERKKELLEALPSLILPGDTVLVKASRSMRFEEITEALLKL